jgi:hypothetical protein
MTMAAPERRPLKEWPLLCEEVHQVWTDGQMRWVHFRVASDDFQPVPRTLGRAIADAIRAQWPASTENAAEQAPAGAPFERPAEFAGTIGIRWPTGGESARIDAWKISFYDEAGPVCTIDRMTLHTDVSDGPVWAELRMFADRDGKPVLHCPEGATPQSHVLPLDDDGQVIYGTFPFLVTSMGVAGESMEGAA